MQKSNRRSIVIETVESRVLFAASELTDTIALSTLAASVSDQSVITGKVTVDVSNNTATQQKGAFDINIVVTPDSVLNQSSTDVTRIALRGESPSIAAGVTKAYVVPVTLKPGSLADNLYTAYAVVADKLGNTQSPAGPTITVRPPIISLAETETILKLPTTVTAGGKLSNVTDKVVITNSGSDPLATPFGITVYATPDGTIANGTNVTTVPTGSKAKINPDKFVTVPLRFTTFPDLADGTYSLITAVTQSNGVVTSTNATVAPTITVGAPPPGSTTSSSLVSSITSVKTTYVVDPPDATQQHLTLIEPEIMVTNTGSPISGDSTLTLFTSSSPTFDSTATQINQLPNIPLSVKQNARHSFLINFNIPVSSMNYGSEVDNYIFIEITTSTGETTIAKYSKTIQFYGAV